MQPPGKQSPGILAIQTFRLSPLCTWNETIIGVLSPRNVMSCFGVCVCVCRSFLSPFGSSIKGSKVQLVAASSRINILSSEVGERHYIKVTAWYIYMQLCQPRRGRRLAKFTWVYRYTNSTCQFVCAATEPRAGTRFCLHQGSRERYSVGSPGQKPGSIQFEQWFLVLPQRPMCNFSHHGYPITW